MSARLHELSTELGASSRNLADVFWTTLYSVPARSSHPEPWRLGLHNEGQCGLEEVERRAVTSELVRLFQIALASLPSCIRSGGVRVAAVHVETLKIDSGGGRGEPLGDGDGAVVVGPPDAGALVSAVDLEEGRPLLPLRRRRPEQDVRRLLLVHHHVVRVEAPAKIEVPSSK